MLNLNAHEYQMSFWKYIKVECIQVFNGPALIKCDTESSLIVHISHASIGNSLALVVVIVVHYDSYRQSLLLTTSQDFHTQMWQEKNLMLHNKRESFQ